MKIFFSLCLSLSFGLLTMQAQSKKCSTCVGDLNGDGAINLLDVAPFTHAVNSGSYNSCADINGDGLVNLLDVDPFTALVQSGATCCSCPGDINGDGAVNLLDVQPFTHILNSGAFNICADINGDGSVNLLDVQPFTDLVSAGEDCCICPGDVNGDGNIDLLDVGPFTDILSSGTYNSCADVNEDGTVDLLDVNPFTALVQSGEECCLCLGDINGDGNLDLLDIDPFVDIVVSGVYVACADINKDGVVNLLDIQAFVDLITSGASCGGSAAPSGSSFRMNSETSQALDNIYERLDLEKSVAELKYFPNPTSDILNLQFELNREAPIKIHIYNAAGQLVLSKNLQASKGQNQMTINLDQLSAGLYILEVDNGEGVQRGKFMLEK